MAEPPPPASEPDKIVVARPLGAPPCAAARVGSPPALALPGMRRRDAYLDLALILTVAVIVPFTPPMAVALAGGGADLGAVGGLTIALKWLDVLLVGGVAAYLVLRHRLSMRCFGLRGDQRAVQAAWGVGTLAAVYGYMFSTVVVVGVAMAFVPGLQEDLVHRMNFVRKMPVENLGASVLLLVPVAVHEELLFRGLLVPYLRRVLGRWWLAIAVSSVVFGALHFPQGWLGVLQITGLAAVLGVCFVLSRSLLAVTAAHFAFDFLQFQLIRLIPDVPDVLQQG